MSGLRKWLPDCMFVSKDDFTLKGFLKEQLFLCICNNIDRCKQKKRKIYTKKFKIFKMVKS